MKHRFLNKISKISYLCARSLPLCVIEDNESISRPLSELQPRVLPLSSVKLNLITLSNHAKELFGYTFSIEPPPFNWYGEAVQECTEEREHGERVLVYFKYYLNLYNTFSLF